MEKQAISVLLALAAEFARATDKPRSAVSLAAAKSKSFFTLLESGQSTTLRKYDEVMGWFSANWPDGVAWPADVPRPAPEGVPKSEETPALEQAAS